MSRAVIISAISTRGGASRMSIPDGSRQRTSWRSDSATRSVGRSRIDGASTGTFSSARRSPNWRLPSISTVRWPCCPIDDGEVERERRLADAALRGEDREDPRRADRRDGLELAPDHVDAGQQVEARERHRQHAVDARLGVLRRPGSGERSGR